MHVGRQLRLMQARDNLHHRLRKRYFQLSPSMVGWGSTGNELTRQTHVALVEPTTAPPRTATGGPLPAPLSNGVGVHDFAFNRGHVVDG